MPDPAILSLLGVEIELRVWRGTDNIFRAAFTDETGAADPITDYNAVLVIVDRPGGTVQLEQVKTPADHTDAAGGITLFSMDAALFANLTGQRTHTWKYFVYLQHIVTGAKHPRFYGDLRVLAPAAPV